MNKTVTHLIGNLAPILSGLLTAPLTARSLGVDARGQLTLILLVSAVITVIGNFGLSWLARADVADNPRMAGPWQRLGLRTAFAMLPVALAVGVVLAGRLQLTGVEAASVLLLFTLSSLSASRGVTANVLIALGRNDLFGRANLAMTLAMVSVIVVSFLFSWLTLAVAVAATAVGFMVQLTILGVGFRLARRAQAARDAAAATPPAAPTRLTFLGVLPRAFRSWLSQLSEIIVCRADVVLLSSQAATYQLGLYSVVALIPQISYQVYSTLIQQSYARSQTVSLSQRTTLLWVACAGAGLVLAGLALPAAYWLLPVIFGAPFTGARDYLLPAAALTIGLATLAPVMNDVALRRRPAPFFASLALLIAVATLGIGLLAGVMPALFALAALFVVLSTGYVLVLNRGRIFWLRPRLVIALFRGTAA